MENEIVSVHYNTTALISLSPLFTSLHGAIILALTATNIHVWIGSIEKLF
jgi:hypothetical protein